MVIGPSTSGTCCYVTTVVYVCVWAGGVYVVSKFRLLVLLILIPVTTRSIP